MPGRRAIRVLGGLLLAIGAIAAMTGGVLQLMFADGLAKTAGVVLLGAGFWAFVFVLDAAFGRPPQFSNRPWERPWDEQEPPA